MSQDLRMSTGLASQAKVKFFRKRSSSHAKVKFLHKMSSKNIKIIIIIIKYIERKEKEKRKRKSIIKSFDKFIFCEKGVAEGMSYIL